MSPSLLIYLVFGVFLCHADSDRNQTNPKCKIAPRKVRKQCLKEYFQTRLNIRPAEKHRCATFGDVENKFHEALNKLSECYPNNTQEAKMSTQMRIDLLKAVLENNKTNDFFKGDGLQCIRQNGYNITHHIHRILPNMTLNHTQDSVVKINRFNPHEIDYLQSLLENYTMTIINQTCSTNSVEYIKYLYDTTRSLVKNLIKVPNSSVKKATKSNKTVIIVVCLVAVALVAVAAVLYKKFVPTMKNYSRGGDTVTYNVNTS